MWRLILFTLTIKFDPATAALLTRLVDALESKQQSQIDAIVARLKVSNDKLTQTIELNTPKGQ